MRRSLSIIFGLAKRNTLKLAKHPIPGLPPVLIPLFMFAAFAGALSALAQTKGFTYYSYTAFEFVFVIYLAAMLTGGFASFDVITDYEAGFGNRLMLGAPRRMTILGGYLLYAILRFFVSIAIIWGVALGTGMDVKGGALDIVGFTGLAFLLSVATMLFGSGLALRFQTAAAGALVTVPIFVIVFLSPVFVPRDSLSGWLKTAADYNPLTPILEAGRGFLAGNPTRVGTAFGIAAGLVAFFTLFALRGMVRAAKGPGARRGPRRRRGRPGHAAA